MRTDVIIEDDIDINDIYWNHEPLFFSVEEKAFLEDYLYELLIDELNSQYYICEEDRWKKEYISIKIEIINKFRNIFSPLEIIAFISCLGGSAVWYGGSEALKLVRMCASDGNELSEFGVLDFDNFYHRLEEIPRAVFNELITILDDSELMNSIGKGHLNKYIKL